MSRTVRSIVAEFYARKDPRDKSYTVIDETWLANAANTTGSDFTKTQATSILNQARTAIYAELSTIFLPEQLQLELSGIIKTADITWTVASGQSTAPIPTDGYLNLVMMVAKTGTAKIVPLSLALSDVVLRGDNRHYVQSANKVFIFEEDTQFRHYGTTLTGSDYSIRYFRLYPWTVAQVEAGTETETINDKYHPLILELMLLIAGEYGARDISSFIRRYLKAS